MKITIFSKKIQTKPKNRTQNQIINDFAKDKTAGKNTAGRKFERSVKYYCPQADGQKKILEGPAREEVSQEEDCKNYQKEYGPRQHPKIGQNQSYLKSKKQQNI